MLALRTAVEASSNRNTRHLGVVPGRLADRDPALLADLAQRRDQPRALARRPPARSRSRGSRPTTARRSSSRISGSSARSPLRGRKSAGVPRRNERIMCTSGLQCSGGIARSGARSTIHSRQQPAAAIASSSQWFDLGQQPRTRRRSATASSERGEHLAVGEVERLLAPLAADEEERRRDPEADDHPDRRRVDADRPDQQRR